jgi:hypothetical protein
MNLYPLLPLIPITIIALLIWGVIRGKKWVKVLCWLIILFIVGNGIQAVVFKVIATEKNTKGHCCVYNMRKIVAAKENYAVEHNLLSNGNYVADIVLKPEQLSTNILNSDFTNLKCMCGGTYSINKLSEKPTCSYEAKDKRHSMQYELMTGYWVDSPTNATTAGK